MVWLFLDFSTISYGFYKLADLNLERGTNFLQKGPQKDLNPCNWILGRATQESRSVPMKFRRGESEGKCSGAHGGHGVAGVGVERDCGGASTANRDGQWSSEGRRRRSGG
jgi:hypothetical protein